MSDEIEELLQRYRPAAPSPELRARVLAQRADRAWPWVAAAAAVLFAAALLRVGAGIQMERAYEPPVDPAAVAIEQLTLALGGIFGGHGLQLPRIGTVRSIAPAVDADRASESDATG